MGTVALMIPMCYDCFIRLFTNERKNMSVTSVVFDDYGLTVIQTSTGTGLDWNKTWQVEISDLTVAKMLKLPKANRSRSVGVLIL